MADDPLDAALGRLAQNRSGDPSGGDPVHPSSVEVAQSDPELSRLVADFLSRVDPGSAFDLVKRTREPVMKRSGLRRREQWTGQHEYRTQPTARGWALLRMGRSVVISRGSIDSRPVKPEESVTHTVAVTTDGKLLLSAVFGDGTIVIEGEAGMVSSSLKSPVVGEVRGNAGIRQAIAKSLGISAPQVGTGTYTRELGAPIYDPRMGLGTREIKVADPSWDRNQVVLEMIADSMAEIIAGKSSGPRR